MKKRISLTLLSAFASCALFAQEELDSVVETTTATAVAEQGTPIVDILISILVFAVFGWMIGHMIYELWIKKSPFTHISVDDMKALRTADGAPAEMSEEESDKCRDLLSQMHDSWTLVPGRDDDTRIITSKKQMKQAASTIAQVKELMPTDPELVDAFNDFVDVLKDAGKRSFTGSKMMLVLLVLFAAVFIWQGGWQTSPIFIFNGILYILASLTPNFMLYRKELKGRSNFGALNWLLVGVGSIITGAKTVRTVTAWSDGSVSTDDDHSQHFIAWFIALIIALMLVIFMFIWATVNYLRNYVFYY